jgi:mRNA-degrading endonuclease RelE of RelBE toxin-antitoxin system
MTFAVAYSNQAAKFLRKADKALVRRIIEKIEGLTDAPVS